MGVDYMDHASDKIMWLKYDGNLSSSQQFCIHCVVPAVLL